MMNYKIVVRYDGSRYKGWQRLKDEDMTIQGKLEDVLSKRFEKKIDLIGSGRTDKGVHSQGQVANFHAPEYVEESELLDYLNTYLPEDILVASLSIEEERFHARYNAKGKVYNYNIFNGKFVDPFERKYVTVVAEDLNIKRMQKAGEYFIGEHDFSGFTTSKSKKKSQVRTINSLKISKKGDVISISIDGNGFLHNMVRIIVGTLIRVGKNELDPEMIPKMIVAMDRSVTGPIADAKGLFLSRVYY
jgi:tRNA pseudouridine38-40 synthase